MNVKVWQNVCATVLGVAMLAACGRGVVATAQEVSSEDTIIGVLQGDADWMTKQAMCRCLRQKGTAKSVPALAALLTDEKLSHMARYALEPMPYPEAGQALRDALGKTDALLKAGVIISIGVRRDPEAVPLLIPSLKDSNADVARAAAGALGHIPTPEAVQALMDVRGSIAEPARAALADGLLSAGQRLVQEGKDDLAGSIYDELLAPAWPAPVRMGAFRGRAYAQPDQTPSLMLLAMLGDDAQFRNMAAQIVAETSGAETTKFYTDALTRLSTDTQDLIKSGVAGADALAKVSLEAQIALLRGLAGRKDLSARPAVAQAVQNPDKNVMIAAVKALGALGSAADVPALVGLLASNDADVAKAGSASLMAIQGADINPAIAAAVPGAPPIVRARLLEVLADRRAEETLALAVNGLSDPDGAVRIAAMGVLAPIGTKDQIPGVMQILVKTVDAAERAAAQKALSAIGPRAADDAFPLLFAALNGASPESRMALIHVVTCVGGPKALEAVAAALADADAQVSGEAARLLSEWTTADAIPQLLKLAQSDDLTRQVLGLRGYVRLASAENVPDKKADLLATAMSLVKRPDEKKLVLGAWGTLPTERSFDAVRPCLDDPAVQNEAALAIVEIAPKFGKNPALKPKAIDGLKAVADKVADPTIRDRAQQALAGLQ